jgi:hypothetical protein
LPAGPLTLEQVLEMAEARSESIAIARAGITRTDGERIRARSGLFPQLSVTGSYERALASEFEGVFDSAGPTCPPFGSEHSIAAPPARICSARSVTPQARRRWRICRSAARTPGA